MKTPRIEETLRRYITEAYPKGQVLELLDQALTEAYQAGQKESNEDIRLLAEEIERLREDVEIARKAGRDEAVQKIEEIKKAREYTGFCDRTGTKIYAGDWLEFKSSWMGEQIWAGMVIFEDGVWTINITNRKTIKNSEKWSEEYPDKDWVNSRAWAINVGYGEYGSWNERRESISEIAGYFKSSDEMFEVRDKFNKKYGKNHSIDNLQRELPVKIIKGVSPKTFYKLNSTGYNQALDDTIKALQDNK